MNTAPKGTFPSTHWSIVDDAAADRSEVRNKALMRFLARYRRPLHVHLMIRHGLDADRAEEVLQGFLVSKVLEDDMIVLADPSRGRFRTFLLTVLDRYFATVSRFERAKRRAPDRLSDLDNCNEEGAPEPTASESFDIAWAREVIDETLREMRAECARIGRSDVWEVFEFRLLAPIFQGTPPPPYAELTKRFGFVSPAQASNVLVTGKRLFERTLRTVIGRYEKGELDIRSEVDDLINILRREGAGSARTARNESGGPRPGVVPAPNAEKLHEQGK